MKSNQMSEILKLSMCINGKKYDPLYGVFKIEFFFFFLMGISVSILSIYV